MALLAALCFGAAQDSQGSAFSIAELGVRAAGMATAFTAVADDASALAFNPAGIAFQQGTQLQMDLLAVVGLFRFVPSETPPGTIVPEKGYNGSIRPKLIPVASMYATHQFNEKWSGGLGLFSPFGLSANFTNFEDGDPPNTKYPGRYAGTRARLESIWLQPTAAYRLTEDSSVALGLALVHTHLFIEQSFLNPLDDGLEFGREAAEEVFPTVPNRELAARSIARLLPEGRSRVAGTSNSPGFTLGYLHQNLAGRFSLGLMYRSAVVHHLKGEAAFAFTDDSALLQFVGRDLLTNAFPNQKITGTFVTPSTFAAGISTKSFWDATFALDLHFQDYRRFRDVPLNFTITKADDPDVRTPAERRLVFDFRDSLQIAFGMEKAVWPQLVVRAGYMYDRTPVVDKSVGPLFPDSSRHNLTGGFSMQRGNMEFSLFYEAMQFVNRTTDVPANSIQFTNGEYRNFAHLFGMGFRLFPGRR